MDITIGVTLRVVLPIAETLICSVISKSIGFEEPSISGIEEFLARPQGTAVYPSPCEASVPSKVSSSFSASSAFSSEEVSFSTIPSSDMPAENVYAEYSLLTPPCSNAAASWYSGAIFIIKVPSLYSTVFVPAPSSAGASSCAMSVSIANAACGKVKRLAKRQRQSSSESLLVCIFFMLSPFSICIFFIFL